jgi:L-threonylcarbamoyladenylate synthase
MPSPSSEAEDALAVAAAAAVLRRGGLVAFPTETVYGLGADARDERAVRAIFVAKGRPADHPLIVHLAGAEALDAWAAAAPETARALAARFWPGPLTVVVRKRPEVLPVVTGGLDTVALRVPDHPVALALLAELGSGIAAPSANRFGAVSPTTAADAVAELGDRVDFVLDGGPCRVGVESTIVDLSSGEPAILRPGGVTREALEEALGRPIPVREGGPVRVPGQHAVHYAPAAAVELVAGAAARGRAAELAARGRRVAVITIGVVPLPGLDPSVLRVELPDVEAGGARHLYTSLREADRLGVEVVLAVPPATVGLGLAVADRLRRAAGRGGDRGPA